MKSNFKINVLIVILLSFISSKAQVTNDSLLIDRHYRSFHFKKPSVNNSNASLIFVMHGSGGSGIKSMESTTKLMALAESENILIVFPDAYKKNWNECRKMTPAVANVENIDENTFFSRMIDYCVENYKIGAR
jgi:polyhydroxybutyrate depolymerase